MADEEQVENKVNGLEEGETENKDANLETKKKTKKTKEKKKKKKTEEKEPFAEETVNDERVGEERVPPGSGERTQETSASSSNAQLKALGTSQTERDIQFVEDVDASYKCVTCRRPLRVPILFEECGHRCCSSCLPSVLRGSSRCPADNTHLKQDRIKVDREFQLQMDNMQVYCSFQLEGCSWEGKLGQLGTHLSQCGHKIMMCPNECGVEFEQQNLEKHMTQDCPKRCKRCRFCDAILVAANELKHIAVCPRFPVTCPNGCKKTDIPRSLLTEHLTTECSKQDMPCPFAKHGCKFRGRKKKIEPHVAESSQEHLSLVNSSLQQISVMLEAQTKMFAELKLSMNQQTKRMQALERHCGSSFTWKIDNYQEKFNIARSGKQTTLFSPAFYSHRGGYRMAMSVCLFGSGEARGKCMSVFVCLCRSENDALLAWPFTNQLTFTLLDQNTELASRKPIEYLIKPHPTPEQNVFLGRPTSERNACFGAPRFVKLDQLKTSDYIVDDSLFIKVSMNLEDMP